MGARPAACNYRIHPTHARETSLVLRLSQFFELVCCVSLLSSFLCAYASALLELLFLVGGVRALPARMTSTETQRIPAAPETTRRFRRTSRSPHGHGTTSWMSCRAAPSSRTHQSPNTRAPSVLGPSPGTLGSCRNFVQVLGAWGGGGGSSQIAAACCLAGVPPLAFSELRGSGPKAVAISSMSRRLDEVSGFMAFFAGDALRQIRHSPLIDDKKMPGCEHLTMLDLIMLRFVPARS